MFLMEHIIHLYVIAINNNFQLFLYLCNSYICKKCEADFHIPSRAWTENPPEYQLSRWCMIKRKTSFFHFQTIAFLQIMFNCCVIGLNTEPMTIFSPQLR